MNKILILFAHPRYEKSRTNRTLLRSLAGLENIHIHIHDLYEEYPDFNIDVAREQQLLLEHDLIVWHYPLYLYGAPAIIKQWMDLVLEHGWAHGEGGGNLAGKPTFAALTTGGTRASFAHDGFNRFTLNELLCPLEQATHLCRMIWLPPFAVQGTYRLTVTQLTEYANLYRQALLALAQAPPLDKVQSYPLLNDWIAERTRKETP